MDCKIKIKVNVNAAQHHVNAIPAHFTVDVSVNYAKRLTFCCCRPVQHLHVPLPASLKNRLGDNLSHDLKRQKNKYANAQSNSLAAIPCKLRFAAKHLLFSHRTCFVDRFVHDFNLQIFIFSLSSFHFYDTSVIFNSSSS
jgi:hypothetical protein